jgi:hypothetical protein
VESIYKFVAAQRDSYRSDTIQITEGYDFSQYETLRTIELYHNSKFISGNKDALDREKPFFNICKFPSKTSPSAPARRPDIASRYLRYCFMIYDQYTLGMSVRCAANRRSEE